MKIAIAVVMFLASSLAWGADCIVDYSGVIDSQKVFYSMHCTKQIIDDQGQPQIVVNHCIITVEHGHIKLACTE
jgi:hypothetical protein